MSICETSSNLLRHRRHMICFIIFGLQRGVLKHVIVSSRTRGTKLQKWNQLVSIAVTFLYSLLVPQAPHCCLMIGCLRPQQIVHSWGTDNHHSFYVEFVKAVRQRTFLRKNTRVLKNLFHNHHIILFSYAHLQLVYFSSSSLVVWHNVSQSSPQRNRLPKLRQR